MGDATGVYLIRKLDRAAYFILNGAELKAVAGQYGQTEYTIDVTPEVYKNIKAQPLVDYQRYMKLRRKLKDKGRKAANYLR